ncbi:MAG: secretin N-terminal domain-containing protein [Candidatus Methylacidiphilales bacterium]|nr:secretin N-terminal domain-containing protein [Candidatus Methylacidiphilales bacterium]
MKSPLRFLFAGCFGLLLAASLPAQNPPATSQEMVPLQLPNAPVETVLSLYEQYTGKTILRGQNITGPFIRLVVAEPVPKDKAVRLIEAALLLNGFSLVPGPDNTVKVLNVGQKGGPRTEGIPIFTRAEDLPPGDQVVSFFVPLTYIDTSKFMQVVQQAASGNPYFGLVEMKDAGAVLVTDTSTLIRQYLKLKELADVPPARLTREFVQLERADAERVAELLNQLIQGRKQNQQQTGGGNPQGLPPGTPGAEGAGSSEANYLSGDIQLTPDRRTNRILVICSPLAFPPIKQLIQQFDEAVELEKPFVRPLKYVAADEVLPVLGELLSEVEGDVKEGASSGSAGGTKAPQSGSTSNSRTSGSSSSSGSGSGSGINKSDQLGSPDDDQAPRSLNVGKTRLIADKRSNAILIIGSPESVNKVSSILDSLDIEPRQVFLSTVIGQLTLTRETEFGVDILNKYNSGIASSSVTPSSQSKLRPAPGSLLSAASFVGAANGLTVYGAFGDIIDAYVRAFEETRNFKVLSRPSVFTSNNKKAVILSGRRVPVPTQSTTDISTGNTNTSINYEDVVLKLEVIPLINSDNEVTLQIAQQNDSIVDTQIVDSNEIPVISTQEVNTTIKVGNNNTVILGGLIEDTASRTETGVPILKDIPLLGYLFKTTNINRPRNELIVMIQPRVIGQGESVSEKSDEEAKRYLLSPDAADAAQKTEPVRTQLKRPKPPRGLSPAQP